MAKSKGGTSTVQQQIDPQTQAYINQMRQMAQSSAHGAGAAYNPFIQAGTQGLSALTGGSNAFLNPYMQQMNPFFAQQRAQAVQGANDQATLAGAFGGDRSQIGAAAAGNFADQNQAQFQYQGFNDAQQRAMQAAQMGFGAIGQSQQAPFNILHAGMGPYGTTQTTSQTQDPFQTLMGLGLTAASFFPPTAPFARGAMAAGVGGGGGFPAFGSSGLGNVNPYTGKPELRQMIR